MASITLRPYEPADRGFVVMSFVRSFGRSAYGTGTPAQVLIDLLEPLLIAWTTTMAVAPNGELLGWLCARAPDRVAWLFVKPEFRRRGVARVLLDLMGVGKQLEAAFLPTKAPDDTTSFVAFMKAHGYTVHFRPYLPLVEVNRVAGGTK